MPQSILIVDDDPTQRRLLDAVISRNGYRTLQASGGPEALDAIARGETVDLMLLDLVMPGLDGMAVMERLKSARPGLPVIVLTAQSGVDVIVRAIRAGAVDFIVKPASPERLQVSIENALKLNALTGQLSRMTRKISGQMSFDDLVGKSAGMRKVTDLAKRGAGSNIPILIEGESGVGKEMVARAIQGSSERAGRPFVPVNCGAIPDNLVESIMFGHERGSFTGASERHIGKFQEANDGTLFLDEIGELKPEMQVKLLRALQEGEVDPVGSKKPVKVDIRLISATNRNLYQLVQEGKFREDLYYRLNVYPIAVPPLRDRREDIATLVRHFVQSFAASEGKKVRDIGPEAMQMLESYRWPGNVRQLENAIFRAIVLADEDVLTIADFPQIAQLMGLNVAEVDGAGPAAVRRANGVAVTTVEGELRKLEEVEGDMIRLAITRYRGQMSEVARRLGIGRSTLYRKVRDLGIDVRGEP